MVVLIYLQADSEIPRGFYEEGVTSMKDLTRQWWTSNQLIILMWIWCLARSLHFAYLKQCGKIWSLENLLMQSTHSVLQLLYGEASIPQRQPCVDLPGGGLYELCNFYKEKRGATPVVVDTQTHPDDTMKNYCKAVGIPFDPDMTSWEQSFSDPFAYSFW